MKYYITQKNRTVPSTPYRIHTWWSFLGTMMLMVLVLSACSEPKTENGGNADDSKTARVTLTLSKGSTAQEPAYPTRDGYIFDGWYTDDNTFLKSFKFKTPITQDITLYARWRPVEAGKYTVSFQMNGSPTKILAQEISKNAMANQPAVPTHSGHVFGGWYTDDKFDTLFDFINTPITEHITLYAQWIAGYTVLFEADGGSTVSPLTVNTGTRAVKPTAPTRSGHVFDGWYTDNTLVTKFNFENAITDNTILYARWNVAPPADASLGKIIIMGTIPSDLSPYNKMVQAVLAPYENGATIVSLYVTVAGAGRRDGSAWEHAKVGTDLRTTLQGIVDAKTDKVYLLLIGKGEYIVGDTLAMKNHVAIVGGWWDSWAHTADTHTILSGDDTRRVFVNASIGSTALLYGVEIIKGKSIPAGGGMFNIASSPVLINVTFSENTTSGTTGGGGMANYNSSPVLMNVTFSGNTASKAHTGGGGMFSDSSSPVLMNVTFSGNTADYGGGMSNTNSSSPVLTNVTFSGNTAKYGVGMFNRGSSPTIVNAVFWGNTATTGTASQIHAFEGGTITLAYSVIDKGDTADGILLDDRNKKLLPTAVVTDPRYTNPSLSPLTNNGGFVSTHAIAIGSSAANIGLYIRRKEKIFYYSEDGLSWYTGFDSDGLTGTITLPANTIDLTATDATGHKRTGRPDAGAYEAR